MLDALSVLARYILLLLFTVNKSVLFDGTFIVEGWIKAEKLHGKIARSHVTHELLAVKLLSELLCTFRLFGLSPQNVSTVNRPKLETVPKAQAGSSQITSF